MAREFMVGTVDDKPLLIVRIEGEAYLLDLDTKAVFTDKPGIPEVTDKALINCVIEAADTL